jgi:hypothetical protein
VVVETRREEVVERPPGPETRSRVSRERREESAGDRDMTKDELLEQAQRLDVSGRSTMTKPELERAVADAEERRTRGDA